MSLPLSKSLSLLDAAKYVASRCHADDSAALGALVTALRDRTLYSGPPRGLYHISDSEPEWGSAVVDLDLGVVRWTVWGHRFKRRLSEVQIQRKLLDSWIATAPPAEPPMPDMFAAGPNAAMADVSDATCPEAALNAESIQASPETGAQGSPCKATSIKTEPAAAQVAAEKARPRCYPSPKYPPYMGALRDLSRSIDIHELSAAVLRTKLIDAMALSSKWKAHVGSVPGERQLRKAREKLRSEESESEADRN